VARFNEQIEPIYALLRETEDVNLSQELLEPEPSEIPALKQRSASDAHHTALTTSKYVFPSPAGPQESALLMTSHVMFISVNCNNGVSEISDIIKFH